jgi:2-oxoglutarate ferredoxin oxidoreductase subunit alpha
MNQWMAEPFRYPDTPMDRGKVLWEEDLEKLKGSWARYRDVDGDGITYRTLPGNKHPAGAYFMRGTGHNEEARYSEDPVIWARNMDRIKKKYHNAAKFIPKPVIETTKGATLGIIAFGSTESAVREARHQLETPPERGGETASSPKGEAGLKSDSMRIRGIPFTEEVGQFIEAHEHNYVVEMNRDGQMYQLLLVEYPQLADKLTSIAFNDGLPATARWVKENILATEVK